MFHYKPTPRSLNFIKKLGSHSLDNFNTITTHCCLISTRVDRNLADISFDYNSLEFSDNISILGVTLGSELSCSD